MLGGDEHAFRELFRRYQKRIFHYALRMSGSPGAAEDVTQEVFLALIMKPGQFQPEVGTLGSYLLGIARNQILRRLEKQNGRVFQSFGEDEEGLPDLPSLSPDPLEDFARAEGIQRLRQAILSLPAHYREVTVLCDLEEMTYLEAAEILQCPVGTVRSRLSRAHTLLIEKLRPTSRQVPTAGSEEQRRTIA
jgi:RNA polymerase sigma-70 factor (ECF subfamily)